MPIHTHYDNLKVTRTAPTEVIRASYKALAQKYHPDLNLSSSEAERIMAIINQSYEVLSDKIKRAKHDEWIAQYESSPVAPNIHFVPSVEKYSSRAVSQPRPLTYPSLIDKLITHIFKYWIIYLCLFYLGLYIWGRDANTNHSSSDVLNKKAYSSPQKPAYVKPSVSPRGYLWPEVSGYVYGYKIMARGGLSKVTIDNTSNNNDVFVKLMYLDGGNPIAVRHFFIPALGQFTLKDVLAGNYDIRYKDLDSGQLSRSESFTLDEVSDQGVTTYSNIRMTLYKVRNGNMQTFGINDTEFGD